MKIKGIGKAEQSVEKLVLAVVALVFLAVLTMQFTLQPNQVEVSGQSLPPERAFEPVARKAEQLQGQVRDVEVEMPESQQLALVETFNDKLASTVSPRPELVVAFGPSTPFSDEGTGGGGIADSDSVYAELNIPAPTGVFTHAFASTLHPAVVMQTEGLANLVPAQQPFDKSAVSIQAEYDGLALRDALEADPEGELKPFPLNWRSNVAIIGVDIERERLVDGEWTEITMVQAPPGAVNMVETVTTAEINGAELSLAVEKADSIRKNIQRPRYYPTIAGDEWSPPAMLQGEIDSEPTEEEIKIARKLRASEKLEGQIEAKKKQIENAGQSSGQTGRDSGGRGGRGGGGRDSGAPPTRQTTDDSKKDKLTLQLENLEKQLEKTLTELDELGYDPNATEEEQDRSWMNEPTLGVLDDPAIPVWAHDLYVVPGATYRYRARVVLNNPAFGRGDFLDETQRHLADSPLIAGAWSEWSADVDVLDEQYFFVSGATAGNEFLGGPRATIEVYRFYYGYWRKAAESVEPGDTVATELKFVNPDRFPIYDLENIELAAADPNDDPLRAPRDYNDPPSDPRDSRGTRPGSPPTNPRDDRYGDPRDSRTPPPDDQPDQQLSALPANAEPGPEQLPVVLDVVLLDVNAWPSVKPRSAGDSPTEVILRDRHGDLTARRPELDQLSSLYKLVADSARKAKELDRLPETE